MRYAARERVEVTVALLDFERVVGCLSFVLSERGELVP
jgi:hypothetical protein